MEEKIESFDICNLDLSDEIFKLRLAAGYLTSPDNEKDLEQLAVHILQVADKLKSVLDGYGYAYEFLIDNSENLKIKQTKTA